MDKKIIIGIAILLIVVTAVAIVFTQNKKQPAVEQTPTSFDVQGMKVDILKQGSGAAAKAGDTVTVNYTGALTNGTKFDSNVDPAFNHVEPFDFTLGENRVIQGWELGVTGMKVGEKRKLTIPPELAYGDRAVGGVIPANSTLVFEVELLSINGK